jgi:hypothetical protein
MMTRETLERLRKNIHFVPYNTSQVRERDLLDSHLEALTEIARLQSDSCAYDCDRCHDPRDPHPAT